MLRFTDITETRAGILYSLLGEAYADLLATETVFHYRKTVANQATLQTPNSGTPTAGAPVAPPADAAGH